MAEIFDIRPNQNRSRIRIHEVDELRRWTKTLGVSSDMLVSAVRAVGPEEDKVREYLRTH